MFDPNKIFTAMEALKKIQGDSKIITNRGILSTLFSEDIYKNIKENPKILNTFNSIMGNSENISHYSDFLTGRFYSGKNANDIKAYNNALNFISDTYGAEKFADFFWSQQIEKAESLDDITDTLDHLSKLKKNFYSDNKLLNSPGFTPEGLDNFLKKNFTNDWKQEIKKGMGERFPELKNQIKNYKSFSEFSNRFNDEFLGLRYPLGTQTLNSELKRVSNISENDILGYFNKVKNDYDPQDWNKIREYALNRREYANEMYKKKQDIFSRQGYKKTSNSTDLYVKQSQKVDDLLRKDLQIKDPDKITKFASTVAERAYKDLGLEKGNYISKLNVMLDNTGRTAGGFYNEELIQVNVADKWETLYKYYSQKMQDAGPKGAAAYFALMKDKLYESLVETVGHEYRHAWQTHIDGGRLKEGTDWQRYKTDYEYYRNTPFEKDAREYGAQFAEKYKTKFRKMFDSIFEDGEWTNNNKTKKLKPGNKKYRTNIEPHEWSVPEAGTSPFSKEDFEVEPYEWNVPEADNSPFSKEDFEVEPHEWDVPEADNSPFSKEDFEIEPHEWDVPEADISPISKEDFTNTKSQTLKNNFFGGNKNNRTTEEKIIDSIIGKQNPGEKTSRVFKYNGKEYAMYNNLEINSKNLSEGFIGGKVIDLEKNELISAREAFPEINQALMDGDLDTAFEKISSFEESKHTFAKSELDEKIVNKHTDNANTQNQNQQETKKEQQARTEQQHRKQEDTFEETRTEQKQQTKENHKENKKLNTENADTSKTKTIDDIETEPIVKKRRKANKKVSPEGHKVKTKSTLKVGKNVKGKDLRQMLVNTTVSKALNTVEETVEKAVETGTKTAMNYQRTNMIHPDQMDDFQIGDLTDEEFEHVKQLANGKQEKIDEWTERRNKARANKVLEHYTDQASGGYYSNSEFKNPYEYEMPNMEFEVDADGKTKINKTGGNRKVEVESNKSTKRLAVESMNKSSNSMDDVLSWMKEHKLGMLDIGMNVYGTVSAYKESRREGRGVVSSAIRAGANFAVYEMLGFWGSLGVGLAKNLPSLAIKGTTLLYKENRKMNSAANNQLFGGAQFYDTQQLATMRQSGMEMAKMAQYNLQQTLMGNEATHFHR